MRRTYPQQESSDSVKASPICNLVTRNLGRYFQATPIPCLVGCSTAHLSRSWKFCASVSRKVSIAFRTTNVIATVTGSLEPWEWT